MDKLDQHIEAEDQQPEAAWDKARAWSPLDAADIEAIGQFQWPGGYEVYFLDRDGSELCQPCALKDAQEGFTFGPIYYAGSEADTDGPITCSECSRVIIEDPEGEGEDPRPEPPPCERCHGTGAYEGAESVYCPCLHGQYSCWDECGDSFALLCWELQDQARALGEPVYTPAEYVPQHHPDGDYVAIPDCSPPDCEAYPR